MVANEPVNMRRLPKKGTTSNLAVLIKGLIVGEFALVGVAAYFWHKLYYDQGKCFSGNFLTIHSWSQAQRCHEVIICCTITSDIPCCIQ